MAVDEPCSSIGSSTSLHVQPNPTSGQMQISSRIGAGLHRDAKVTIWDVAGRHVRTLIPGAAESDGLTLDWDGLDAAGRPVQAGVYLLRLTSGDTVMTRTVTILR